MTEPDKPVPPDRSSPRLEGQDGAPIGSSGPLSLLLGQLPIVLWTTDLDLRFTLSTGEGLAAYGLDENRIVGMTVPEVLGTEDPENEAFAAHRSALEGQTTSYVLEIVGAEWSCHVGPLRDHEDALVGTVGIGLDITQRREAEEALRKSEVRYRRLFEENRDVVFISTPEGRLIDINPAGVELFGFDSKEEILDSDISDLYWRPMERALYLQSLAEEDYVRDFELELKSRDGRKIIILENAHVVRDEDGEPIFFRGSLRDVTDQRDLEKQLRQAVRMEAVGRLAGAVAHDFNNLLTVVKGRADLLLAQMDRADHLIGDVEAIREAGDRASELTRRLLVLRRHQDQTPTRVESAEFLAGIETRLRRVVQPRVELVLQADPDTWPVKIDPNQIEQALTSMAVNAQEAMAQGGKLVIETANVGVADRWERRRVDLEPCDYVLIQVRDTGHGMSEEVREHVFEPFFSTRRAGSNVGLGLTTVYAAISRHQGHIRVDSEPGKGATFSIYLPRFRESGEE